MSYVLHIKIWSMSLYICIWKRCKENKNVCVTLITFNARNSKEILMQFIDIEIFLKKHTLPHWNFVLYCYLYYKRIFFLSIYNILFVRKICKLFCFWSASFCKSPKCWQLWQHCDVMKTSHVNRPLSNYASVPANNSLKSRLRARKYSKCIKTWHEVQVIVRGIWSVIQ